MKAVLHKATFRQLNTTLWGNASFMPCDILLFKKSDDKKFKGSVNKGLALFNSVKCELAKAMTCVLFQFYVHSIYLGTIP